jgi:hypothetical protein
VTERLPLLLTDAGFQDVGINVVQPMGLEGEVKLINAITMENIAEAILEDGLASPREIGEVVEELYELAFDKRVLVGVPRIFQVWGTRQG